MAKYPTDQFDDIPADLSRVGAHRAPQKSGRGWVTFAWAALFTGIFVLAGLAGLSLLRGQSFFGGDAGTTSTPSATPTAEPLTDPTTIDPARAITITVLNGSTTVGAEKSAGNDLVTKGWPVTSMALASDTTQTTTIVYYSNPLDEDIARGLVGALGGGEIRESTAFIGAPITIVLGSDYTPPAV
jgi:hypothetical protein